MHNVYSKYVSHKSCCVQRCVLNNSVPYYYKIYTYFNKTLLSCIVIQVVSRQAYEMLTVISNIAADVGQPERT